MLERFSQTTNLPHSRFVEGWVKLYYGGDDDILQDCELQNWITDINTHGLAQGSGLYVCVWFGLFLHVIYQETADSRVCPAVQVSLRLSTPEQKWRSLSP